MISIKQLVSQSTLSETQDLYTPTMLSVKNQTQDTNIWRHSGKMKYRKHRLPSAQLPMQESNMAPQR
jgi:ribosomal protein S11